MEFINQWVTQIIIFILLATIIDLLIPATSMKKYIKLIMGLILMLIFLKPVFFLFSIDFQSELTSSFEEIYEEEQDAKTIEKLTNDQKEDIQAVQVAYILEEMSAQLKSIAKDPLQNDYGAEIRDIDFIFMTAGEISLENLGEVIVYLDVTEDQGGKIRLVDEVIIGQDQSSQMTGDTHDEDIIQLLQEMWDLHDKKVAIKWEGGTS